MTQQNNFKMTEIGEMPVDWEVVRLREIGVFSKGQGIRKDQSNSGEIPCIRYGELYTKHNNIIREYYSKINQEIAVQARKLVKGSILFAGSGETKEEIGKCAAFIDDVDAYAGGDIVILEKHSQNPYFLGYLLNFPTIQKQKASRGQGDAVVHISGNQLSNLKIPLPPLPEQTAIANALSDMDALIAHTQQRLDKKKAIRQGLMQQLLMPKEGWEEVKFGEICYPSKTRFNPLNPNLTYKCVELEHLSQSTGMLLGYADSKDLLSQKSFFEKGDILFGKLRPYLRKYLFAEFDGVCTTEIWVLKPLNNVVNKFLYYIVQSDKIIESANISAGTKMPRAEWKTVSETIISLPPLPEQTRIANILTDADAEIQAIATQLTKLQQQKQGMMQVLLTGKIRLLA